jgi:protein TonB
MAQARAPFAFDSLILSALTRRQGRWLGVSLILHLLVVGLAVLAPLWLEWLPAPNERVFSTFFYDPPPPPPLPLPLGRGLMPSRERPASRRPVTPAPESLVAPAEAVTTAPAEEAEKAPAPDEGDASGSPTGVPEGMEGGDEAGAIGGVPGGVPGGVVGGTGTGPALLPVPVPNPDQPPRPLRITRPEYPHDAFVRKVEGVVVVEILIDDQGKVCRARVVQSVPLLDAAALAAVWSWSFAPARHQGRPVAALARAPVTFRVY